MKDLKILWASETCGISQNSIIGLDLEELYVSCNEKVKDVSHMKNLKILDARGDCGIDQNGINGLDLDELNKFANSKITQPYKD